MSILIAGANGRTSRFVIQTLLESSRPPLLRLLVHSDASIEKLKADFPKLCAEDHQFVVADYLFTPSLFSALDGVRIVFYNGPAFESLETAMGIAMIDAAKKAGVEHFVLCSVLHPLRSKMLNHKAKLPIEEYLIESGLNYTIIQPTHFMQNLPLSVVLSTSTLTLPYSHSVLQGFLDLVDLAAVARSILLDPTPHIRARYELLGQNLTYTEVAEIIRRECGNERIACVQITREEAVEKMKTGFARTDYGADGYTRMLFYYNKWGLTGNSNVLRWLLGREPSTWETYLRRELPKLA